MEEKSLNEKIITFPLTDASQLAELRCGEKVLLSGVAYTSRDAAHKRMVDLIAQGEAIPFPADGALVYYAGPAPTPPGKVIGSIGPTTSSRMDAFAPTMIAHGVRGLLGKGKHNQEVAAACRKYGAVYFATFGGAAALLAQKVKSREVIAWPELGTEAVSRLEIAGLPAVVVIDSQGNNLFAE